MPSTSTDRLNGLSTSVAVKAPVKAVAVANITLSGEQTVNGVAVVDGDRVLVTAQSSSVNNGIYDVSTGDWTRSLDFDGNRDVRKGTLVVFPYSSNVALYQVTSADPMTIGTSNITFALVNATNVTYPITDAEISAGITASVTDTGFEAGDVRRYGAVLDGVTSDSTAFNAASLQWAEDGGAEIYIPSGYTALLSSQWTAARPTYRNCSIHAYGSEIKTSGAISALKITGGAYPHSCTVYGLNINHRANASATAGVHLAYTSHVTLVDTAVEGDDNDAAYAGILVEQSDAADTATGCFWTRIVRPRFRQRTGADGAAPTVGVLLRGSANATVIRDGSFTAVTGIRVEHHPGQTYVANGVLIDGNSFEGCTTAISFNGDTTSTFSGVRIVNNRGETLTNFLELTGSTTQPAVPIWMSGNYMISSVTNYLVNTNSLYVNNFDFSITPDFGQTHVLRSRDGLEIVPLSGSGGDALTLWSAGTGTGVQLKGNSGTATSKITWGSGTPEAAVTANVGSIFLRADGGANTSLYVKESGTGNTGWVAK